jgi:serine/threonine protein kinase
MEDDNVHASATGRVLGGRYRVGEIIRSGGMGSVYEGEHTATGRQVALKLVHLRAPVRPEIEDRFEREARIASNIQSKHIVQVFDAGRDEVLGPFIAMELLRGEDLEERLTRTGALPSRVACEVAYQAARGLEKAHASNIAHRDLKPGNIFLVDSDEEDFLVKVLDFGIAKLVGEIEASAKLTRAGTTLGTPQYMSPEQARGQEDIDARTDIYSLGAVLFEAIVGRSHVPELANYNQLVIHIATEVAPRISSVVPEIDPRIDRLVADMLVSDRRDRLQTMRMVKERLAAILGSAVRLGSAANASGSFTAGRAVSSVGFSSARLRAAPVSARSEGEDEPDSEEVHFFDRDSFSPLPAALPLEPAPSSAAEVPSSRDGEEVVLFDRASLHLPLMVDRTSSSAHVIDDTEVVPQRLFLSEPVPRHPFSAPPTSVPVRTRKGTPRRVLLAAVLAGAAFVTVGSVRLVRSFDDGPPVAAGAAPPLRESRGKVVDPVPSALPSMLGNDVDAAAAPAP